MNGLPQPGWYADPEDAGRLRWWDGAAWTGHLAGAAPPPAAPSFLANASPRQRPRLLRAGAIGAALVIVIGSLVAILHTDHHKVTWQGQAIRDPSKTLHEAETALHKEVATRHGVVASSSRCYFVEKSGSGAASDVQNYARCGPVQFVDGKADQPWLSFKLTSSTNRGESVLTSAATPQDESPDALLPGEKLVRPDGKHAPSGDAGLKAPAPPPAAADYLAFSDDTTSKVPSLPHSLTLQGWTTGVEIQAAGVVKRFGTGDAARSAAPGHKLVGAVMRSLQGEFNDGQGDSDLGPSLGKAGYAVVVDGTTRGVAAPAGVTTLLIVSVPSNAKSVQFVFIDNGAVQKVSMLDGIADAGNPAVLSRQSPVQTGGGSGQVGITFSKPGYYPADSLANATVEFSRLTWFGARDANAHPSAPDKAWLRVNIKYDWGDGSKGVLDAGVQSLQLPDGSVVHGVDLDPAPDTVWTAFEVPATFTTGTVLFTGSAIVPSTDVTETVHGTVSFPISIPPG